jgi:hypothetical protein
LVQLSKWLASTETNLFCECIEHEIAAKQAEIGALMSKTSVLGGTIPAPVGDPARAIVRVKELEAFLEIIKSFREGRYTPSRFTFEVKH